jgi:hypothetical protein
MGNNPTQFGILLLASQRPSDDSPFSLLLSAELCVRVLETGLARLERA